MTDFSINPKFKRVLQSVISIAFWILVWYIISKIVNREVLVASPFSVLKRLIFLVQKDYFWMSAALSLLRIMLGFAIAVIAATILAVLSVKFKIIQVLLEPLMIIIKSTPVASFIILAIVWLKVSHIPAFTSFLMVFPVMWTNVFTGIKSTDNNLIEMVKLFKIKKSKVLTKLYVPSVMPYFKSGCISCIGLAWKAGIAAEVLCTPKNSIGKYLYESKIYLETADLFAWTIVIIVLSLILEKLLVKVINKETD
jgi:ABC-type nitrate/sulfonate/bicarbonate transport system, permease component